MNELNNLQKIEHNIAKEVIKICEDNNLTYYLAGGTYLGAVRHNGFIPWDDDIDLSMPREDYEVFLTIAPNLLSNNLKVVNYRNDKNYHYYITRVRDLDSKVEEIRIEGEDKYTNASIDIFPLDGTPNNLILRKLYYFKIMFLRAMVSMCYKKSIDKNRKRNIIERCLIYFLLFLPIDKILDPYKLKCIIDKSMRKYSVDNSKYVGCLMGAYRTNEMVPYSYYGSGTKYKFEEESWNGPENFDAYLSQFYGDYMMLPPEEDRKIHFNVVEK